MFWFLRRQVTISYALPVFLEGHTIPFLKIGTKKKPLVKAFSIFRNLGILMKLVPDSCSNYD
jgi:hypothetical protein